MIDLNILYINSCEVCRSSLEKTIVHSRFNRREQFIFMLECVIKRWIFCMLRLLFFPIYTVIAWQDIYLYTYNQTKRILEFYETWVWPINQTKFIMHFECIHSNLLYTLRDIHIPNILRSELRWSELWGSEFELSRGPSCEWDWVGGGLNVEGGGSESEGVWVVRCVK